MTVKKPKLETEAETETQVKSEAKKPVEIKKEEIKPEVLNKHDKFFSVFGKVALVMIILGLIGGGAYYYGSINKQSTLPTPTLVQLKETKAETGTVKTTPTTGVRRPFQSGIGDYIFTGSIPQDWKITKAEDNFSVGTSELNIERGEYALIVRQSPRGVGACGYPDAPGTSTNPEMESPAIITKYTQFLGFLGEVFRRQDITANPSAGVSFYGICQKNSNENFYQNYTKFGEITYHTPLDNPSEAVLKEIDSIVATFKK